ncbi:MAG TPA: hypothetical protein VF199_09550 [Bacillales bacterium]
MVKEKRTARGIGRPLVIIFIILIIAVASFGAYIQWGGSGLQQWAGSLPVVSSLVGDNESAGTEQQTEKVIEYKARVKEQRKKIANLEQSVNGKEQQVERLEDQVTALQQRLAQQNGEKSTETVEKKGNVAKVYAEMPPQNAADILNQLENNEAIHILSQLKPEVAALIMAKMDKEKAAKLTVLWTGNSQ